MKQLGKTYDPKSFEDKIYQMWEEKGAFRAEVDPSKKPFTIMMPPPNITGQLHMGHALDETFQDIIIRRKRMQGFSALWLPGTDHASIATEVKIVAEMAKAGETKESVGRDGFLERAFRWKEKYGGRIVSQLKKLGSSCDWSREAFTMDERCSKAVKEVFVNLYEKGLIYQGSRIINWCPSCKTALSDAEVEYAEQSSHLWHLRYPYEDGSGYMVVATTRPETMQGDTAVAVNPNDPKYKDVVGKMLKLPLTDRTIPVIADDYVEEGFGTGAVKITPAHDPNDFEVGLRHSLPVIRVIADDGTMNENATGYTGMSAIECRKQIVEDLEKGGFIEKIEPYTHNVGVCYRCGHTVEPIVSKQWFVKMEPLAKPAIEAVNVGKSRFVPERFSKIYYNWMENIKDWCISRQLWWGHRIPAYYCEACGETVVAKETPTVCPKCGNTAFRQDEDVLDTWFSSALWPFSTLGYPDKTEDLEYFYPTDLLITAYDIIFFWVARMIFSGIEHMGETPFKEVLIHGIVRDAEGRKMSKSLGNGVDPLEVIEKFGADSLRFSLVTGVAPGSDIRYQEARTESARNFMNKIWNATKFYIMNAEGKKLKALKDVLLTPADVWILDRLRGVVDEVNHNAEKYELGLCTAKIYEFVWSTFCDWYVELLKPTLYGEDEDKKSDALSVLKYVLETSLKLTHPFLPFVTEEIWQNLYEDGSLLMLQKYPDASEITVSHEEAENFDKVQTVIRAVRNIRAETGVAASKKLNLFIVTKDADYLAQSEDYMKKLSGLESVTFVASKGEVQGKLSGTVLDFAELYIPLGELVDFEKEAARLKKEIEALKKEIARGEGMLKNEGFLSKAPEKLVKTEKEKLETNKKTLENMERKLQELQ